MDTNPLSDVVSSHYDRWKYPQPILDLPSWLAGNWEWFDPSHAHRIFWPNLDYKPDLNILIAGCGTNQAAVFAYTNPEAKVVAIDVSQSSLDHHRYLKNKYKMNNLELHLLPIEDVSKLNCDFDLIVSTGVLHHLAEPLRGLKALAACLRQDGVIAIMLYAKYGRIGVEMMQSIFRDIGLYQNDASVLMIRDLLAVLPQNHPVRSYMEIAPDLQFDVGLVDTFLHNREQSYSIEECFNLVKSAGLVFQDLFMKSPYYPPHSSTSKFYSSMTELPEVRQWSMMERINSTNACHFFTACRQDRQQKNYKIDFTSVAMADYVPSFRYRCTLNDCILTRYDWSICLDLVEMTIVQQVDGRRTIKEIMDGASESGVFVKSNQVDFEKNGQLLFQRLWQLDFLSMGLKS